MRNISNELIGILDNYIENDLSHLRAKFKKMALKMIEEESKEFSKKYPFVKSIECSMGTIILLDKNKNYLPESDYDELDKLIADNPDRDEDEICEEYGILRHECIEHRLIYFLNELQYHPLGFCPEKIIFNENN